MSLLIIFAGMLASAYIALRAAANIATEGISALVFFAFLVLTFTLAAFGYEAFERRKR